MSIAPVSIPSFGVTPGFGINPAYGVAAAVPHTNTDDLVTGAAAAANALGGPASIAGATGVPTAAGADVVGSFGQILASKINALDGLQKTSDALATKAVTGDLQDIHEYTIAANEANVATQLTVAVRNKAVEAFNEIMRMQM